MRISESIRKNVFEVSAGRILNKLKIKRRRNTLFFEEIGSEYIRRCEEHGYGKEMMCIGQEWMLMFFERMIPGSLKKIPPITLLNLVMKNLWITGGLMNDFRASKRDGMISIKTKNEGLTRFVGRNHLMVGFYMGIVNSLFRCEVKPVNIIQTKEKCEYAFRFMEKRCDLVKSKEKSLYDKLNHLGLARGFTLKDLLESKVFQLKENNRIYFRNRSISPIENTLFHLIGNKGILMDEVPKISYDYFRSVVKDSSDTRRLVLIKTLLQAMGWGVIKIVMSGRRVVFEIKNPPYGLRKESDNWDFLIRTVLGYLWLLNKKFRVLKTETDYKHLRITYSS